MNPKKPTYDPDYLFGPGAIVGEYLVESKIAEGGMGEVWVGRHPKINKRVAIKVLAQDLVANKKSVARFMQEALAVNEIRHRNLVDVFSFGELPDGRPYILMEFLEGKTLADYMKQRKVLPFSEVLELMRQISEALQAAHDKNIVHRDLKPENIFVVQDGGSTPFIKLLDFGIAKLSDPERSGPNLTRTGAVFGTPAYMSPEQCEGSKHVDHRSDIYALGILTYEMISGRTPFRESSDEGAGSIIAKQIHNPPPPVSSQVSGRKIPKAVDAYLLGVLSKDADDRPQRCLDFYQGLLRAVGSQKNEDASAVQSANPIFGDANRRATTKPPKTQNPKTGNYYAGATGGSSFSSKAGLVGLAVVALLGAGFYLWGSQKTPPAAPVQPTKTTSEPVASLPVTPQPKKVMLIVGSTPEKANVFLDNKLLGITPLKLEIDYRETESTLRIDKDGFEAKEIAFTPMTAYQTDTTLKKLPANTPAIKKTPKPDNTHNVGTPNDDDPISIDLDEKPKK